MTTTDAEILLAAIIAEPEDDTVRLAYADWLEENGEQDYAEFIRAQIEIPKLLEISERWVNTPSNQPGGTKEDGGPAGAALGEAGILESRVEKLWGRNKTRWFGDRDAIWCKSEEEFSDTTDIYPDLSVALISRGFISRVRCTLDQWRGVDIVKARLENGHFVATEDSRRTTGIGPRIARANPVEYVEVTDVTPPPIDGWYVWMINGIDKRFVGQTESEVRSSLSDYLILEARQQPILTPSSASAAG